MNEQSPVAAYHDACKIYWAIEEDFSESPLLHKKRQAQQLVLQSCVARLLQAANSNDPAVWHALGNAFNCARGVPRDVDEAIRWYQRAADAGHAPSMVSLALRLQNPEPARDQAAAIQWLQTAAEMGDAGGMIFLGFAYREGKGVRRNYSKAVRWFIKAVEAGDTHSMIHVGRMYAHYQKSPAKAVSWFLRTAQAGLSESFIELADLYDDKASPVYDPVEAHKWFRVVAEFSEGTHSRAVLAIARQYSEGLGVPCDLEMAKLWLRRLLQAVPAESSAHRDASRRLQKLEGQFL